MEHCGISSSFLLQTFTTQDISLGSEAGLQYLDNKYHVASMITVDKQNFSFDQHVTHKQHFHKSLWNQKGH